MEENTMCTGKPLDENELEHMTANEILEQSDDMDFTKLKDHDVNKAHDKAEKEGIAENRVHLD